MNNFYCNRIFSFVYISLLFVIILSTCVEGIKRHLNCTTYQFDDPRNGTLNLVHVRADGAEDAVHYIWSTYNLPSVIVTRTTLDTEVKLDVGKLQTFENGALTFSKSPLAFIGLTVTELFQLSYQTDTADIEEASEIERLNLHDFLWNNVTEKTLKCLDYSASLELKGTGNDEIFSNKGLFELQFSVIGDEEVAPNFPHLIYSGNSTQIKIGLDSLYSKNSTRIRYGVGIQMISRLAETCTDMHCKLHTTKLISDEFSPGIFSDVDILSPCFKADNEKGSFLTWMPVSYTSKEPSVANSAEAKLTSTCSFSSISHIQSVAELFFNNEKNIAVNIFNLTFGTKGDGFYPKTEYSSWSLMLGTGVSVHPKLSVAVIIFITVGMASLLIFLVVGVIYYAVRWFRKKDDDLLLGDNSTDSDLNQPNSAAICSSKSETTNSKSGVKSPRKNKHAQLREAKGDGRKKPPKIKKTEIPALDLHPTADDYTMLVDMESGEPTSSAIG
ncbi:glycosylated lysosomal membrane protein B [Nephila pilipes]|uniref:Glycosylated lysosomal membrane protein B n=1 Tax=Nephila pilipes TaxID=299642 RepID=A0A8X6UMQ0_NEPPI|nr:glycosylated lysosomal membrane protein B [Nephila pilipes]